MGPLHLANQQLVPAHSAKQKVKLHRCLLPNLKRHMKTVNLRRVMIKHLNLQNTQKIVENLNMKNSKEQVKAPLEDLAPTVKTPIMLCEMKVMLPQKKEEGKRKK